MWTAFMDRAYGWSDFTVLFGLNLLLQSTLIILIGLAGVYIFQMRRTRAAIQSLLLRICLVGVLLAPAALLISTATGMRGLRIEMPLHGTRFVSAPAPPKHSSVSLTAHQGDQFSRKENSARSLPAKELPSSSRSTALPTAAQLPAKSEQPSKTTGDFTQHAPVSPSTETPGGRTSSQGISHRLSVYFLLIWVFLALFLTLRAGAITLYIRRIQNLSFPLLPHHSVVAKSAADELGISLPTILQSPYVSSALLTGVIRPVILIPFGGDENLMATREIFLHELAHLARRDPLWLHLCHFAKILFPFQPLLWVLARRIEELSDFACDDYVIRHTGGNRTYAAMLLNIARSSQLSHIEAAAGAGIFSSRFPLVRRLQRILDNSYSRHVTVSANEIMSFTIIFLCAVTLSGFIGFRGEDTTGTVYAAEQHSRQGGKNLLKKLSRLRVPLSAPLAALTTKNQQANASLPDKADTPSPGQEKAEPERTSLIQPGREISAVPSPETFPAPQTVSVSKSDPGGSIEPGSEEKTQSIVTEMASIFTPVQTGPVPGASDSTGSHTEKKTEALAKTAPRDSLMAAGWLAPSSSATAQEESAVATAGQLKITVPNSCEEALKESLEEGQENPVWSPTGKVIAFTGSGGKGIWVVPPKGGMPNLIHDNTSDAASAGDASGGKLVRTLCFSPDGKELTYVKYTQDNALTGANKKTAAETFVIESINLVSGERRLIAERATDGSWSRDGRYFVYVGGDSYGIGILDVLTGKRRQITETGLSPCLTPDGASVIYVDQSRAGMNDLYRVPLAGGTPEQLTSGGRWRNPKISPDGVWVLSTGYGIPQYSQDTLFWAFNLQDRMSYFMMVEGAETSEMGSWSPTGRQFCYTLTRGMMKNGFTVQRSAIYIADFQPSSLNRPTEETAQPHEFKLVGNFPNPFNPSTTIQFSLPSAGPAELDVYNMLGQKIRSLVSARLEAGMHSVVWNGRDQNNKPVSSGIYVARLKMEGKVETRRMTLVK